MFAMRLGLLIASVIALAAAAFFAANVVSESALSSPDPTPTPLPTLTPTPTPTVAPEATPTADAVASPTCDERMALADQLAADVTTAMEGYDGTWAFAIYDPKCAHLAETDPEYTQYSASAGKIVSIIGALRAVEDGRAQLSDIENSLEQVLTHSWDNEADYLETFTGQPDYDDILEIAGTETARFSGSWHSANMGPADMARIWEALISGRLLNPEHTELIMTLAAGAIIPDEYRTFPDGSFSPAGFRYGQKAGYYVSDGVPYYLVGAGYILHEVTGEAFFPAWMAVAENENLLDPQRRLVFPMVFDYVVAALGPEATGID